MYIVNTMALGKQNIERNLDLVMLRLCNIIITVFYVNAIRRDVVIANVVGLM